ncbi:MAG TPA: cytochrome c [Gammaproteobacteria bacterium]|nr:cytochrome c [Gammaproteobacteria bacterium]
MIGASLRRPLAVAAALAAFVGAALAQQVGPAAGSAPAAAARAPQAAPPANVDNGARLYNDACVACHGIEGEGGEGGGAVLKATGLTRDVVLGVISDGRNRMPSFRDSYTDQELRDVAAFVAERISAAP